MRIMWCWSSNIWLRILIGLHMSPVIVEVAGECGIIMGVVWNWSSDVWLWVLILISLSISPIVMNEARKV